MSWLSNFLHPGRGYQKGQAELDKYYQQAQQNLAPYSQHGLEQYGNLNEFIQNLMNPEALQSKWAEGYTESPAALQAEKMAQEHGLNAANAMGLTGSNSALNALQSGTSNIAMEDRQHYLDNLMQKYLAGAGLVQGAYGTGASAAGNLSNNAMNMGQNSANLAYGQENAGGNILEKLLGSGIGLIGSYLGSNPMQKWNLSGGA